MSHVPQKKRRRLTDVFGRTIGKAWVRLKSIFSRDSIGSFLLQLGTIHILGPGALAASPPLCRHLLRLSDTTPTDVLTLCFGHASKDGGKVFQVMPINSSHAEKRFLDGLCLRAAHSLACGIASLKQFLGNRAKEDTIGDENDRKVLSHLHRFGLIQALDDRQPSWSFGLIRAP